MWDFNSLAEVKETSHTKHSKAPQDLWCIMTPCFVGNPFQDALVQPGEHPGDKLQGGVLHVGVEGRGRGGVVGGFVIAVSSSLRSGHESMTFLEGKHETVWKTMCNHNSTFRTASLWVCINLHENPTAATIIHQLEPLYIETKETYWYWIWSSRPSCNITKMNFPFFVWLLITIKIQYKYFK